MHKIGLLRLIIQSESVEDIFVIICIYSAECERNLGGNPPRLAKVLSSKGEGACRSYDKGAADATPSFFDLWYCIPENQFSPKKTPKIRITANLSISYKEKNVSLTGLYRERIGGNTGFLPVFLPLVGLEK